MMARRNKLAPEDLAEKKRKFEQIAGDLEVVPTEKFLTDNFLPYAWSYVLDRALVDVSGLKPVQRRILYTLWKDRVSPTGNRSKVATLAGRVLHYHPHGNVSVEDSLKAMAQEHVLRVPLIDGKGDFGVPGTPGAAARYLEARLNKAAWINVEEIGEHAVPMMPNYDGTTVEPTKIPVRWPVAVINGGAGIAVGYASNMPSHNPNEIMAACQALLKNPELSHEKLATLVQGPDFNMGGLITSRDGIVEYLKTGKGSFKIRGQYDVTPTGRNSHKIEFYEIPYGQAPEKILTEIQKRMSEKGEFKEISSYKNLSDLKHPIRIVIETKPSVNYKKVVQDLFKFTSLEVTFSANVTTIVDNRPVLSPMRDLLLDFITFRKQCIHNKSRHSLGLKEERLHLVEGLLKTLVDIDKAIAIIRKAQDATAANSALQRAFKIDERQAEHVLSLQLRRLTKMDSLELEAERKQVQEEITYLQALLTDEDTLKKHLSKEFQETLKVIGDPRKTEIMDLTQEEFLEQEKLMARELKKVDKNLPCYVSRFASGLLMKTEAPFTYGAHLKRLPHGPLLEQVKVKSQESIALVGSDGKAFMVPLSYIPQDTPVTPGQAGAAFATGVELVALAPMNPLKTDVGLLLATERGDVKLVRPDLPQRDEFLVYNVSEGDRIIGGEWVSRVLTEAFFISVSAKSNVLIYPAQGLRATGATAGGVRSQKLLGEDDRVVYFGLLPSLSTPGLMVVSQGTESLKLTPVSEIPPKSKGAQGVNLHKFRKGEENLVAAHCGSDLALTMQGVTNVVMPPPVTKRAMVGTEFKLPTLMGSRSLIA